MGAVISDVMAVGITLPLYVPTITHAHGWAQTRDEWQLATAYDSFGHGAICDEFRERHDL
jgi:hypothetical protein